MSFVEHTIGRGLKGGAEVLAKATHNGNGKSTSQKIGLEMLGFGVAEGVSMLVGLGVYGALDQVAPGVVNGASDVLAKTIIEPNLESIENAMNRACKLEECKADTSIPRDERARRLARTLVLFGASGVAIIGTEINVRRGMNHVLGVNGNGNSHDGSSWKFWKLSRKEQWIFGADKTAQIGSMIIANLVTAGATDELIRSARSIMIKCGVPQEKAHELAGYTMIWELPNFLGLMAGLTAIYATHKWPQKLGLPSH